MCLVDFPPRSLYPSRSCLLTDIGKHFAQMIHGERTANCSGDNSKVEKRLFFIFYPDIASGDGLDAFRDECSNDEYISPLGEKPQNLFRSRPSLELLRGVPLLLSEIFYTNHE